MPFFDYDKYTGTSKEKPKENKSGGFFDYDKYTKSEDPKETTKSSGSFNTDKYTLPVEPSVRTDLISNEIRRRPFEFTKGLEKSVQKENALDDAFRRLEHKGVEGAPLVERPSYLERVREETSKAPSFLQPLVFPMAAIAEAPFSRAIGESLGTVKPEAEGYLPVSGAGKIAGQIIAPIGEVLSVPGAQLGGGALYSKTGDIVTRLAPRLGNTGLGRTAEAAIKLGTEGAITGAGGELVINPDATGKELLTSAAFGAGGGAIPGGLGKGVGEGVRWGRGVVREALEGVQGARMGAIDTIMRSDLPQYVKRGFNTPNFDVSRTTPSPKITAVMAADESIPPVHGGVDPRQEYDLLQNELKTLLETSKGLTGFKAMKAANRLDFIESRLKELEGQLSKASDSVPEVTTKAAVTAFKVGDDVSPVTSQAKPVRLADLTAATKESVPGQRGFVTTLQQSGKLTDDVSEGISKSSERNYTQITNRDTVDTANQRIAQGIDKAEADLLGKSKYTADDVATGMRLIDELQKAGNTERAVTVAENLAKQLTEAGQTVQAASIWNRLTPEGALVAAQRKVKNINDNLLKGQEKVEITPKQADDIMEAASIIQTSGASKERAGSVMEIMDRLKAGQKVSDDEMQLVGQFVEDAKRFVPEKQVDELPAEFKDTRKRDKILSYLEKQAEDARKQWNAKRNIGFAQKIGEADIVLLAKMGTYHLAKGAVKAADFTEAMVKEFGESVRPYMSDVYERAKKIVGGTSKHISQDKFDKVEDAFRKLSGQAAAEKAVVQDMANHVKKAISEAKNGTVSLDDIQRIRDFAEEIASFPVKGKQMTDEQRFLQSVKSLAKKLADVESEKVEPSQVNREVSSLLRQVTKIAKEGEDVIEQIPIDNEALNNLSYQLLERTKPSQAEKIAQSYIEKNAGRLGDDDIEMIRNLAQEVSALSGKEQQIASQDLQAIMNGFERAGIGKKVAAAQYISLLLNPKTQVRNVVGNELMYRAERLARFIGTPIDIVASKITGGPRTVTFKSGPSVWDEFFTPAADFWKNLVVGGKAGARGVNPEGLTSKYDIRGQAFRSKWNPLTYMEKALGASLQGFDYAAYTRATNQRMKEMAYLDALNKGIKGDDAIRSHMQTYMTNLDEGVHSIAKEYGKFATLQDDTVLAQKLMGFRAGMNKLTTGSRDFGLGSLVVPFAKTPANLLLRGLDYSPAGILKAVKQAHDVLRKPNTDLTRADVIASVSRAIMGTGMGALAYWLADKGAMFGQSNKDSGTRKLQQMVGIKDFQINGSAMVRMIDALATGGDVSAAAKLKDGDTLWSYEWAQPTSMPMAIGSNVYQSRKQGQGGLQTAGEAALSGFNTLFNSSVLSGIREAFQIPMGEDNAIKAIGMNLVKQAPSMFTPTILRNINTYFDNKIRETYTPDDTGAIFNQALSGVPGQAQNMPQRVNTLGEPQTRPNSFLDVFVSPSDRSKYKPSPEAKFVLDLLNETGDTRVAPRAVAKYLSGKDKLTGQQRKIDLTPDQYVRLQTIVGQETAKRIMKINPNLSTEKKIERVIKAMDEAGKIGRNALKKELGLKPTG